MIRFCKKYRLQIFLVLWVLLYPLFLELTGIGCPFRFLFGIQCPGCGFTRAVVCVMRLDFASAFAYHPAWFVPPVTAVLAVAFGIAKKEKAQTVSLICGAVLLLVFHVARCIF